MLHQSLIQAPAHVGTICYTNHLYKHQHTLGPYVAPITYTSTSTRWDHMLHQSLIQAPAHVGTICCTNHLYKHQHTLGPYAAPITYTSTSTRWDHMLHQSLIQAPAHVGTICCTNHLYKHQHTLGPYVAPITYTSTSTSLCTQLPATFTPLFILSRNQEEQQYSAEQSALVNRAYSTLQNPYSRGIYLVGVFIIMDHILLPYPYCSYD